MALMVEIKVVPSAGKALCKLDKNGMLKCYLKSPPEKGKANKELVKMLAKALRTAQKNVSIVAGQTAKNKRIKIAQDITFEQLLATLGIERQMNLF